MYRKKDGEGGTGRQKSRRKTKDYIVMVKEDMEIDGVREEDEEGGGRWRTSVCCVVIPEGKS